MSEPIKLYLLTATEILALLRKNTISVEEYARSLLGRIDERDSIVKAWAYLEAELVLSQARELDKISAVDEAPLGLGDFGSAAFNWVWTGMHMPVIDIPAFSGEHGMPIGLPIVAGRFHDQHLLMISKILSEPFMAEGGWRIEDRSSQE